MRFWSKRKFILNQRNSAKKKENLKTGEIGLGERKKKKNK